MPTYRAHLPMGFRLFQARFCRDPASASSEAPHRWWGRRGFVSRPRGLRCRTGPPCGTSLAAAPSPCEARGYRVGYRPAGASLRCVAWALS